MLHKMFSRVYADSAMHDPYKNFRFEVEISGGMNFARAGFQKVSGLKQSIGVIEYREGTDPETTRKSPGMAKFDPITLERGQTPDNDCWTWARMLFDVMKQIQGTDGGARANVRIKLRNRAGEVVRTWVVPNAWVSDYETGDFDSNAEDIMIERITIQHEGFYNE